MFKNPFQVAITFAIIALVVKLSAFSMGIQHGAMEKYIFSIYMLLLLLTVSVGIRSNKIMNKGTTSNCTWSNKIEVPRHLLFYSTAPYPEMRHMVSNQIGATALQVFSNAFKATVEWTPTPKPRLVKLGQLWFANCHVVEGLLTERET